MDDGAKTLLLEAQALIDGDRQAQHGDPLTCHARVAKFWSIILDREVTPIQVVQCLMALKMARAVNDPTFRDNYLDIAGYAGLSDIILGKKR